ncbi:MAG: lysylphosphatidylglycerol synthase domain-containing protein, partial [Bifidobacteriaceae bacterium]|nr:lysylphosphatidylglycerol synthase domain-containing protein [Bifidobacteriaceae bacterium]
RVKDISEAENPTERLDVSSLREGGRFSPHDAVPAFHSEAAVADSTASALEKSGGNRVYAVFDADGERWDAIVLDGDRQALGVLQATWRALRLRGVERRSVVSLRQAAERAALLGYAASAAGVRTPRLVGLGEAADSMMLLQTHPFGLRSLVDLRPGEISEAALVDVWRQLERAHQAGLAHRDITAASLLFSGTGRGDDDQQVWLIGWEEGDVASSELARSMDCAQMLAVLALTVGPERAVAAAGAVLPASALAGLAGLLQPVVFPAATRELARAKRDVIEETRQLLAELAPSVAPPAPFQLVRFGWRTVLIAAMTLVAIWAVFTRLNFDQMMSAVARADPWWMALSFGLSLATYVGAAVTLVCLVPVRLSLWRAVLSQVAGSFAAITMPGGVGPIALSLRFLNRSGVRTSLAAASVALTQVALFAVTLVLLIGSAVATGETGLLSSLPTTAIIVVVAVVVLLGCLLLIPALRGWLWAKAGPTLTQVWPRVIWVLGRPKRLVLALAGTVLQFGGYVMSFWAAMMSFGLTDLQIGDLALVFLVGNTAGSAAPTPGGLGGVEIALTAGLRALGVATATAASAALLFRVITYWARVPLGWAAFRFLTKRGSL